VGIAGREVWVLYAIWIGRLGLVIAKCLGDGREVVGLWAERESGVIAAIDRGLFEMITFFSRRQHAAKKPL